MFQHWSRLRARLQLHALSGSLLDIGRGYSRTLDDQPKVCLRPVCPMSSFGFFFLFLPLANRRSEEERKGKKKSKRQRHNREEKENKEQTTTTSSKQPSGAPRDRCFESSIVCFPIARRAPLGSVFLFLFQRVFGWDFFPALRAISNKRCRGRATP